MSMKNKTLSGLLKKFSHQSLSEEEKDSLKDEIKKLQLKMLRIQQGVFHRKDRLVIVLEGFDAAGKGGTIRKITKNLDPRSVRVIPIGPPTKEEQGTHWLFRFWRDLPKPGTITIFDRSWYGRVLVEKVEKLAPADKIQDAYREINEFEAQLQNDGIVVIKFFLAISKREQKERFQDRINDPYKQWKITEEDIKARKKWNAYVRAVDIFLAHTDTKTCPWHLVRADSKKKTRQQVLSILTHKLVFWEKWMEKAAHKWDKNELEKQLANL